MIGKINCSRNHYAITRLESAFWYLFFNSLLIMGSEHDSKTLGWSIKKWWINLERSGEKTDTRQLNFLCLHKPNEIDNNHCFRIVSSINRFPMSQALHFSFRIYDKNANVAVLRHKSRALQYFIMKQEPNSDVLFICATPLESSIEKTFLIRLVLTQ